MSATGGISPYRWKRTAGTLPRGLRLHLNGLLTGKPKLRSSPGTYSFTVQASTHKQRGHPTQIATQAFTLVLQ